jgi:hypothetical protein
MIVESMNDFEFVKEVMTDYTEEMMAYVNRAMAYKGKLKKRHKSNYRSKRGNDWLLIYTPERGGQNGMYIKRPQPNDWFTWYGLMLMPTGITLFGFNKHVAERISERYYPNLTPSEALKTMLMRTPAIIQSESNDGFYTHVDGGICIGSAYGKRIAIPSTSGKIVLPVELRETRTFVSNDMLFDDQKKITRESIENAIKKLGKDYLSDSDR